MSKEEDNKVVVGRGFTEFWGKDVNLAVVDEIAAPDMLLRYALHEPRRGREDITGVPRNIFCSRAATQGFKFEEHSNVVLERFEVLWPNDRASELVYISRQRDNAIPEKSILEGI